MSVPVVTVLQIRISRFEGILPESKIPPYCMPKFFTSFVFVPLFFLNPLYIFQRRMSSGVPEGGIGKPMTDQTNAKL